MIALGIAKDEVDEKKICTLRVSNLYAGRGLGYRLMDEMLHWLDVDQPHVTVGAHKWPLFERMFDHYQFQMTDQCVGLYRPSRVEFGFNGGKLVDQFGKKLIV